MMIGRKLLEKLAAGWMIAALTGIVLPAPCAADEPLVLSFVDSATFFSQQAKLERSLDPQAFVYAAAATVGTGPQGIEHIAGLRNVRLDDEPLLLLYNAEGKSLALTVKKWLSARGTLQVQTEPDGRDRIVAGFKHLVPFGEYSLFLETLQTNGKTIARPLDSDGSGSTFTAKADGSAMIALDTTHLPPDHAVALVYHSDGQGHGVSRGQLGVTAHERLFARL